MQGPGPVQQQAAPAAGGWWEYCCNAQGRCSSLAAFLHEHWSGQHAGDYGLLAYAWTA